MWIKAMMVCEQCPRMCNLENLKNGFCQAQGGDIKIAKVMRHFGEEPIICSSQGCGAIFFSYCNLRCPFCQNYPISHLGQGKYFKPNELADIFKKLEEENVDNIDLVSPTHYTNKIIEALKIYRPKIPIIWNCSGYENPKIIEKLKDYVDIFLVDFKYYDNKLALKYSNANNYFEFCTQSILQMRKNLPTDIFEKEIMKKGIIIRHLVLPGNYTDSIKIFDWIKSNLGTETIISLMSQYSPCFNAKNFPEINKPVPRLEYKIILEHIKKLNFEKGYYQSFSSVNNYIPNFNKENFWDI